MDEETSNVNIQRHGLSVTDSEWNDRFVAYSLQGYMTTLQYVF